jgi:hypothetical protein
MQHLLSNETAMVQTSRNRKSRGRTQAPGKVDREPVSMCGGCGRTWDACERSYRRYLKRHKLDPADDENRQSAKPSDFDCLRHIHQWHEDRRKAREAKLPPELRGLTALQMLDALTARIRKAFDELDETIHKASKEATEVEPPRPKRREVGQWSVKRMARNVDQ